MLEKEGENVREQKEGQREEVGTAKGKEQARRKRGEGRSPYRLSQVRSVPEPHTRPSSVLTFPRQNNARLR